LRQVQGSVALPKLRRKRSEGKSQLIRLGHREIETVGLSQGFWTDLYYRAMTAYWPVFFGSAALIFIAPGLRRLLSRQARADRLSIVSRLRLVLPARIR